MAKFSREVNGMKQWIKKGITGVLCASLAFACVSPAMAQETSSQEDPVLLVHGKAEKMEDGRILLQNPNKDAAYAQVILNITENTVLLDASSNSPQKAGKLKDGETVYAYISRAMTRSMPPISNAAVIFCNVPENYQAPSYQEFQEKWTPQPAGSRVWGTVTKLDGRRLMLENESAANQQIILNISDDTYLLDAVSGNPVAFESLRENQFVFADIGLAMALSMPPIAQAEVLLCNLPADYRAPDFHEISSVFQDNGGGLFLKTDKGGVLSVGETCKVIPYLTKNTVSRSDLLPGSKILVWRNPADPFEAERVMLFPYEYRGYLQIKGENAELSGEEIDARAENGLLFLPLHEVCGVLGMDFNCSQEKDSAVILENGELFASLNSAGVRQADGEKIFLSAPVKTAGGVYRLSTEDTARLFQLKIAK